MINYVSPLIFIALFLVGDAVAAQVQISNPTAAIAFLIAWVILDGFVASAVRLAAEWERAVVFRLGKFRQVKGPGLFLIVPLVEELRRIDTRVQTIQIARQQVITKDNVPVSIDAVLLFKVVRPSDAVIRVQDFRFAISQYARTSLRDVIGQMTLDQLLTEREQIESAIAKHVERAIDGLGPSASNTVVLAVPVEMMEIMTSLKDVLRARPSRIASRTLVHARQCAQSHRGSRVRRRDQAAEDATCRSSCSACSQSSTSCPCEQRRSQNSS